MDNFLSLVLSALKVPHTKEYTSSLYNEHPDKNNLFGLSSMFNEFGVDSQGFQLDNYSQLLEIDTPFIAHWNGKFILVYAVDETKVIMQEEGGHTKSELPIRRFQEGFSGYILSLVANNYSIEPNYYQNHRNEILSIVKRWAIIVSAVLLIIIGYIHNGVFRYIGLVCYLMLDLIGLYICRLLLLMQIKRENNLGDQLCQRFSNNGCGTVLSSDAAKFLGGVSWSESGFGYFLANIIIEIFSVALIDTIVIGNLLLLPFTFVSVGYQKKKIKQWCLLCLMVMMLLWLMAFVGVLFVPRQTHIMFQDIIRVCGMYTIIILMTHYYVKGSTDKKRLSKEQHLLAHIKRNATVFDALLKQQQQIPFPSIVSSIIFGNPHATLHLTVVSNPHCRPCAKMHKILAKLLSVNPNSCVTYIFASFKDSLSISNRFLIAIYQKYKEQSISIFDQWFDKGMYDPLSFMKRFPVNIEDDKVYLELLAHRKWVKENEVSTTPTVAVNGFLLPGFYSVEDLFYIK